MKIRKVKVDRIRPTFEEFMEDNDLTLIIESDEHLCRLGIENSEGLLASVSVISKIEPSAVVELATRLSNNTLNFPGKLVHVPILRIDEEIL